MTGLHRAGAGRPAPPVRLVHLGLGNFFRAHAAAYTDDAGPAAGSGWGFAAFGGRVRPAPVGAAGGGPGGAPAGPDLVRALAAQDGLFTLLERAPDGDRAAIVGSVVEVQPAGAVDRWRSLVASPDVVAVTLTVTEAGYALGPDGSPDLGRPDVAGEVVVLRAGGAARTVPGRLVDGLRARRASGGGPVAVVPCDNVAANGPAVGRVVRALAHEVDPALAAWIDAEVSFVATVVDRITPRATAADVAAATAITGWDDPTVVVTEPYREWVLAGSFPAGRPPWEQAGAVFVDDVSPYEARKLLLLNGAHSLLAYLGLARGHATVADALRDDEVARWVQAWWAEARPLVPLPADSLAPYEAHLLARFANPRLPHRLAQIAVDGSQKLPLRVLPVLRAERAAGRVPPAAVTALAAWMVHVRRSAARGPADLADVAADRLRAACGTTDAVPRLLAVLGDDLAGDADLVAAVADRAAEVAGPGAGTSTSTSTGTSPGGRP